MADPEKDKEAPEEELEEEEEEEDDLGDPANSLTQLIDRNKFLIEGLKQQLEKAKRRMMESPEEEE